MFKGRFILVGKKKDTDDLWIAFHGPTLGCVAHIARVVDRVRQRKVEDEEGQGTETKAARASCLGNDALGSWMEIGQDFSIVVGPGGFYSRTCIEGNKEEEIN